MEPLLNGIWEYVEFRKLMYFYYLWYVIVDWKKYRNC